MSKLLTADGGGVSAGGPVGGRYTAAELRHTPPARRTC